MPWITSLGRRPCNDCRTVAPKGESVYQGTTGMIWCGVCAVNNLNLTPNVSPDVTRPGVRFPDGWGKFKPAAVPSWTERED